MLQVVTLCTLGAVICLVCFCLEAWYCSGFDVPKIFISQYYQSWLAATVLTISLNSTNTKCLIIHDLIQVFFGVITFLFIVDTFAATHYAAVKQKTKAATAATSAIYSKTTDIVPHHAAQTYASPHTYGSSHLAMAGYDDHVFFRIRFDAITNFLFRGHMNPSLYYATSAASHPGHSYQSKHWSYPYNY